VHVIDATGPMRLHATAGSFRPIARVAMGKLILSSYEDAQIGRIVRRINSEESDPEAQVHLPTLMSEIAEIRANGFSLSIGGTVPGGGSVACFLPEKMNDTPLVLAIGSGEYVLRRDSDRFVDLMREAIALHYATPLGG